MYTDCVNAVFLS